ncbi:MAG: hypothetical protein HGA65_06140 [Oscillochloris sp.]|nr:hypothetical protein [Oscillochloris sp.]
MALATGQTSFLVPACSPAAALLLGHRDPRISVALDSHIFDPSRPSLDAYAEAVAGWYHQPHRFSFAISYDHLNDPERSLRDYDWLCNRLERLGVPTADGVVVPVVQRGAALADALGPDSEEWDEVPLDELLLPRDQLPAVAIGGLAFAQYGRAAMSWLVTQLHALGRRPTGGAHLLGLSRPDVVSREVVVSFDSSRPVKQAAYGWPAIAPRFSPRFGFDPADLMASRNVRLAYWIAETRDRIGLGWNRVAASDLPDDVRSARRGFARGCR